MNIDRFIPIKEAAEMAGYTINGMESLCRKHGIGERDYDNEKNEGIEDEFDKTYKYKGMVTSDYVALFGWD